MRLHFYFHFSERLPFRKTREIVKRSKLISSDIVSIQKDQADVHQEKHHEGG
jgi:hypothetical protein